MRCARHWLEPTLEGIAAMDQRVNVMRGLADRIRSALANPLRDDRAIDPMRDSPPCCARLT
jgi:hypothetical protein